MLTGGIPFLIGIAGFCALILFRFWEVKRGARLFEGARRRADETVRVWYRIVVMGELPHAYRIHLAAALRAAGHHLVVLLARALRALERPLLKLSHQMRRGPQGNGTAPSSYLKTLSSDSQKTKDEGASDLLQ
jgi:hypothetical protein